MAILEIGGHIMGESAMNSAVLTATIKSMKLLSTMNTRQEEMAKDIHTIKNSQQVQVEELKKLNAKSNNDALREITNQLNDIVKKIDNIDLDSLSEHLEIQLDAVEKNIKSNNESNANEISTKIDNIDLDSLSERLEIKLDAVEENIKSDNESNAAQIFEAISESDKSENTETLMKLIEGLRNMQKNVQQLATRVETLSTNVQNGRKDTKQLTETILESNTRIMSMDLRMAALTSEEDDNLDADIDSTIAFLEGFGDSEFNNEDG